MNAKNVIKEDKKEPGDKIDIVNNASDKKDNDNNAKKDKNYESKDDPKVYTTILCCVGNNFVFYTLDYIFDLR